MSGIFGIVSFSGGPDNRILLRMAEVLAHRGPDGIKTWQDGPAGLGHCMLHTTPESLNEHLPFATSDGTLTVTADARIDNREELISDLDLDQQSGIIPDSSLVLDAYRRWGASCVDHLLGDFAFAIWDAQKQQLFCARDHLGVRPFYYYHSEKCFAFGSEMKALFSVPGIPREIDERALAFQLAGIPDDPAITTYSRIRRLPAAKTLNVSSRGMEIRQYWAPDPGREVHFDTDSEYETAFRTIFSEAVRCRLRSAFPIGSELSGGLDSSAVTCVARHLLRQEIGTDQHRTLHTFSAVFDEVPECDERTYIRHVLAGGDLLPHYIYPERISPLSDIGHRIAQNEEPTLSGTSYTYSAIYQTARDAGVRVVLSGEWGDVVVSYGNGALLEFILTGKWLRAIREIFGISRNYKETKRSILWNDVLLPLVPPALRKRHVRTRMPMSWFNADFAQRTGLSDNSLQDQVPERRLDNSRDYHLHNFLSVPVSHGMEAIDKNAAGNAVESRYPFLDRRVVEFCLALPPGQRIRNGFTRAIERDGLSGFLPPEIRQRTTKAVADPYIKYSLAKFEKENLEELLFRQPDLLRQYINLDVVQETCHKMMAGAAFHLIPVWRSVMLAVWLRREKSSQSGISTPAAQR